MFDIEGHRGARGLKPENTLPGFEIALDFGVTSFEIDVHLSADDEVVVWHDPELVATKARLVHGAKEVGDSFSLPLPIRSLTMKDLKRFKCDLIPNPDRFPLATNDPTKLAGSLYEPITIGELFTFVERYARSDCKTPKQRQNAGQLQFNIEIKRVADKPDNIGDGFDGENPGILERKILESVDDSGIADRVILQSFNRPSLYSVRDIRPDIKLSLLSKKEVPDADEMAKSGFSFWSPHYKLVTKVNVAECHFAGLKVIPWTVNSEEDMTKMRDVGCDGFITDRPDTAVELCLVS